MKKNKTALCVRFAYIGGTCVLLFIGVLILYGDKTQRHTPVVRIPPLGSVENTVASEKLPPRSQERALYGSEGSPDELSSDEDFRIEAFLEAKHLETEVPSRGHIIQDRAADTEQAEDDLSTEAFHQDVHGFMEALMVEIKEKYPDVIELVSMSPEEILEKYPTEADLQILLERIGQYEADFMEDIRDTVKALIWTGHAENLMDGLSEMKKTLRENWGDEIAKKIMENIETQLDLR